MQRSSPSCSREPRRRILAGVGRGRGVSLWWREEQPWWTLALAPLSFAYGVGARAHRLLARPVKARVPVISIGNLTAGGAGKTPVTIFLAQELARRGKKPAVLSRGYGRT